jgi:hypothetical protein
VKKAHWHSRGTETQFNTKFGQIWFHLFYFFFCFDRLQSITAVFLCPVTICLWRKVVCFVLFCSYEITEPVCFRSCSWCLWKALEEEGCMGLVPWRLDLWCKNSWILNDFFTEIKLNPSWKLWRNWNVPLGVDGKILMSGI